MGVNDWSLTRNEIISKALRLIGVLPTGDTTSSDFITAQTDEAQDSLNMILSDLVNHTTNPFRYKTYSAPLVASDVVTGSDSLNYTVRLSHTSPNASTWSSSTAYSKGALVFPTSRAGVYFEAQNAGTSSGSEPTWVSDITALTTDNTISWKACPDSKPITGGVDSQYWEQTGTGGVAYAQNTSYRAIQDIYIDSNVISISKVWYRDTDNSDTELEIVSRDVYNSLIDKYYTGDPTLAFFDNQIQPILRLWPIPTDTTKIIMYEGSTLFNDMDSGSDTLQGTLNLKTRWTSYLVYALACDLGEEYQLSDAKLARLERKRDEFLKLAKARDNDNISCNFLKPAY